MTGQANTVLLPARRYASAYVLAMARCLPVCLSVTSRNCIETAKWIKLVLAWRLPLTYISCIVLHGNSGIPKNKDTSSGASSETQDLKILQLQVDRRTCCQGR